MMEMVRVIRSFGIVRFQMLTSSLPFHLLQIKSVRRVALVVLIPPPVEPGEAPMNMRTIIMRIVALVSWPMSTVLKPAVRGVTDWKSDARICVCNGIFCMT